MKNMQPVKTKNDFYKRWAKGEFGNKIRSWNSLNELKESGFKGAVGVRYSLPNSSYMKYSVPVKDVDKVVKAFVKKGAKAELFKFSEDCPDEKIVLQGEVMCSPRYLDLRYSTLKGKMRDALKIARNVDGIEAFEILRYGCDPGSLADIYALLDLYPDHVVEFSCYSINLGDVPNRNTLIWEVRQY